MVRYLRAAFEVSERRACRVVSVARSVQRYRSIASRHELLRSRIRELALTRHLCPVSDSRTNRGV